MIRILPLVLAMQVTGETNPPPEAGAIDSSLVHANGRISPTVIAIRSAAPIKLDGVLDEEIWQQAEPVTGFRRERPGDGEPAAESTAVRVVFDDRALYVGVRLYNEDERTLSKRLGRRDDFRIQTDKFFVIIDPHHDHRTAVILGVTTVGVLEDGSMSGDRLYPFDMSWNPVWEARTTIDSAGWTAEMRIPFSQLRFSGEHTQVWGIQFMRIVQRAGEMSSWAWTPPTEPGYVSKFGHLLGLSQIPAPRRLEVLPYVLPQSTFTEGADPQNPFNDGSLYQFSGGADLKYGVTSDLTLDVSVNPDFGQVDADPAVVNLTNFETFFPELRPLFIEGANIFDFGLDAQLGTGREFSFNREGSSLFYSRRIGRAPSRSLAGAAPYVNAPTATSILGAAKLSGKTRSGWSIGVFQAVTAEEHAQLATAPGQPLPEQSVEPLTSYSVARGQKDFGQGSGQVGFALTGVHRNLSDPVFNTLTRAAYSGGVDFVQRFKRNAYALNGVFAFSHLRGDPAAMLAVQQSSGHYFQRPDQDYLTLDSAATMMNGSSGMLSFAETEGDWTFGVAGAFSSPGFEINDAGFQTTVDRIVGNVRVGRRWLTPGPDFRALRVNISAKTSANFDGANLGRSISADLSTELNNLWRMGASGGVEFERFDDRETRGGPLIVVPAKWNARGSVNTDFRKIVSVGVSARVEQDVEGSWAFDLRPSFRITTRGPFTFSVTPAHRRSHAKAFYVTQRSDPLALSTFGRRFVFSELDQTSVDITLRADLALTPKMTVQLYAQPLIASGSYAGFKEYARPSSFDFIRYDTAPGATIAFDPASNSYTADADGAGPGAPVTFSNPDFSVRSLRTNFVFRWEYAPGSTVFLVWSQSRFTTTSNSAFDVFNDFGNLFQDNQQNILLVKLSYWLSY